MHDRSNAYVRRALLERLGTVGLCPDLRQDEEAVQAVCAQTGVNRNEVVAELTGMRAQCVSDVLSRFGVRSMPAKALAGVAASRDILRRQIEVGQRGRAFYDAYREHAQRTTQELIADLEINPLAFGIEHSVMARMEERDTDRVRIAYEMNPRPGFERPEQEIY